MRYSDNTLLRMTKTKLIEQLRCAEHNQAAAEKMLAQQAENLKDWEPKRPCRAGTTVYQTDGVRHEKD